MKKLLLFLFNILLFTQCAITTSNTKTDYIKIQVLDEAQNPIKDFYIITDLVIEEFDQKSFYSKVAIESQPKLKFIDVENVTGPEYLIYEVTNSPNGTMHLPMIFSDEYIYIGSKGYLGTIIQVTDTVIVLKKEPVNNDTIVVTFK